MKMQEVIVKLRKLAPVAADSTSFAEALMCELIGVMEDMANATTLTASKAIAAEALKQAKTVQGSVVAATKAAKELQALNASYKEKLGPRTKKPKDAEGQQMLPGFGDEGGTPTTMGETSTTGGGTPSFTQSGRHG